MKIVGKTWGLGPMLRAASHYGHPSQEAMGLSGETLSRVQKEMG